MQEFFAVFLALAAVIGLLFLTMYITKRLMKFTGFKSGGGIKIIDCVSVGQDKTIAAVRAGEKKLLVGITSAGINVLCELSDEDIEALTEKPSADNKTFGEIFAENLKEKFVPDNKKDGRKK